MKRVAMYIRVSSDKQVQEGDSLSAQRDALISYVNSHDDMVIAGEYMDDGVSGQKFEQRDELQKMLAAVRKREIDLIIFTKLDRFFRSVRHYAATQDLLNKYGVKWIAIWEPIYDTTTPTGQLMVNQMMSFAQFEAQNTGTRIRQVQAHKISQGEVISGSTPPGYSIKNKKLIPNDDADSVRTAFKEYARTGLLRHTLRACFSLPGLPRSEPSFKKMLANTVYIGEHRGNPDFCEAIIDQDTFDSVQRQLQHGVRASQKRVYIFTGLLSCGECGRSMASRYRVYHRQKGDVVVNFYNCPRHLMGLRDCPNAKMIREPVLERYLVEHIQTELKDYVIRCEKKAKPAKDNRKKIAALEAKLGRLKELYLNDLIPLDEYKADRETIITELDSLRKEPTEEPLDMSAYSGLLEIDLGEYYYSLTPEKRRTFWRSIIKEIRFGIDRVFHVYFY